MVRLPDLFPEPINTVQFDKTRAEPRLWVRRLVIWETPDTIIRDIPLRRGMNIIWSPDPGELSSELGQSAGSGHGAGKTLFCRLLRYCLGEAQFANSALRLSIAETLPSGLVGAEVVINGTPWAVIRPIGATRKHWAIENKTLEEVLEADDPQTSIAPLLDAISSSCISSDLVRALPGSSDNKEWLYALGWMSRDQECRYDHILDWRHQDADTGSPLRDLSKDQILLVIRLYLRLISTEEMTVRKKRDDLPTENALERDIEYNSRRIEQTGAELAKALNVAPIAKPGDPVWSAALSNTAKQNLKNIQNEGVPTASTEQLTQLRKRRDDVTGQIAVISAQLSKTDMLIELQDAQSAKVLGEKANLVGDGLKAQQGDYCPVCYVPIDRALAEGCGLSHMLQDAEKIEGEKSKKEVALKNCNDRLQDFKRQKIEKKGLLTRHSKELENLDTQIAAIEKQDQATKDTYSRRLFGAEDLNRRCDRLNEFMDARLKILKSLENRKKDYDKLKGQLDLLREQHRDTMTRLNELFNYVSKSFLGADTKGTLTLSGERLKANVQVGGLAMVSLKAILFDITALLMSLEGRSELPAFLMHDSPREADLSLSLYHSLFRLLHKLESPNGNSPFQYIITTTTEPPEDIRNGESLIITLDGSVADKKLLRRNFLGGLEAS